MKIKFFNSEVESFIQSLEAATVAKVLRAIDLLEMFGERLGLPHSRKVARGLFELRVRGRQEVRLFYAFWGGAAVFLHGFLKKTSRLPAREMKVALRRLAVLDDK